VQGTAEMLAGWLGVDPHELDYRCVGINHQAFYLDLKHNGEDMYPKLFEALERPEVAAEEPVRNEMFRYLRYYPTESSGHNSEYNPWFRKRPDLIQKYCSEREGAHWNPGKELYSIELYEQRARDYRKTMEEWLAVPIDKNAPRSPEYAAEIFNAMFGDGQPIEFNGNVINDGCIPNLPADTCVEIPVCASRHGLRKCYVGPLPDSIAGIVSQTALVENMAVDAIMEKNRQKLIRAVFMDPLSSAVLSLAEIESMCNEMFEANNDYLGDWK
jgi:alpha-galactosidase